MSAPTPITLDELREIDLFDDLDEQQLAAWAAVVEVSDVPPGTILAEQGEPAQGVHLLLSGSAPTMIISQDRAEPVGRQVAPTWMGAVATITGGQHAARMQTDVPARVGLIRGEDFLRLAREQQLVHDRVMAKVSPVVHRVAAAQQNRERLAALGTMAAGLAHELNNPAAAARRAAAEMAEAVTVVNATLCRFVEAGVSREEAEQLIALQREAVDGASARTALDALDAADAEDELQDALAAAGVADPWRLTEPLAAAGVGADWLQRVASLAGEATEAAVRWVAATLTAQGLAAELKESTDRMSALVGAVKSYAYMDRGELVEIDVHEGLETTLVLLGHKLKHTTIAVVRDYDRELPRLTVRGPELNQVWTNLLDNAIQALGDGGTITIATRRDGASVRVDVSDDGPGIPPDVRERVFDSFFTTKDVGQGTGLGLTTARNIVVDRHQGSMTVESGPGRTTFSVLLPIV